jgi:aspartate/methionine/tyrosine aminotransferase
MITLNHVAHVNKVEQALTEIEALGLASQHDLANGHASQELAQAQQHIIAKLPEIWTRAAKQKSRKAELMFKDAFRKLAQTPSLINYEHFKICPTASNSIDVVATWLAEKQLKTALIEPTFDNLYLILKRRGIDLTALPETLLHTGEFKTAFSNVDALFLVNPNNPTGKVLSRNQFVDIAEWCAANNKVLILDNTFRFFVPQLFDAYQILLDSGVTFLSIEDTGKVWPTQEIKASLLFCSSNIIQEVHIIYDEIFLCHSNFALGILSEFLLDAHERGLAEAVWHGVATRRQKFREALNATILDIHPGSELSAISVEWVVIKNHFEDDLALADHFQSQNLILLPGRQFYWSKKGEFAQTNSARFALLKPESEFLSAIDVLSKELGRLN